MSQVQKQDTIIALSSGQSRAGVSVFRVSGPQSDEFLIRFSKGALPEPRKASVRWIVDEVAAAVDEALVLRFEEPRSFTGENLLEVHCHGSLAVIEEITRLALSIEGFRLAEPGEFSRRAFENGKLDLVQAEGIADIIDAATKRQLQQAVRFVAGDASDQLMVWRKAVLEASAYLAATIDFSDEGDVGENAHAPVLGILDDLEAGFSTALENSLQAARIRDGIRIAIMGAPNVGKSTLLNALAKRDAAIVSDIAGTTRDILETHLVIEGVPVVLADTAGLRDTEDQIEAEGVRRARKWADSADIRLYLTISSEVGALRPAEADLWIGTKSDFVGGECTAAFDLLVSAATGSGMDALVSVLANRVRDLTYSQELPSIVRIRHQAQIGTAISAIRSAKAHLSEFDDVDLAAFELSIARSALDQILGRVDVEDILGEVFSGFCVGK